MLGETLWVFIGTFTDDAKYHVKHCENLPLPIKMQLSVKRKILLTFLFHFWNLHQILNFLKKRMIVTANLYPKLQSLKILVRPFSKKRRFRTRFHGQHVKVSQILAKSP